MKRQLALLLILAGAVVICGCAVVLIGAGAGAGVAAYTSGKVTRTYDAEYHRTIRASIETLDSLKLPVSEKSADTSKTVIHAKRADGTPVSVEVVPVGPVQTEVGIRTGTVGIGELGTSEQIQDRIGERLSKIALEESKAAARSAEATQPETVEEPRRAVTVPAAVPEKVRPPSTQADIKQSPPELTIYFSRDSNELLQREILKLNKIVAAFAGRTELKLILNGYADASGSRDHNRIISESRAAAVKMYFAGKGVDPARITVVGHGAKNFAASNASEEGRQKNRRVEIELIGN
jgi:outer membrane protein OmpA-like peptidoglycan-associated protein